MPTAGAAIRAIPEVVAAGPGHLTAPVFAPWTPRLPARDATVNGGGYAASSIPRSQAR
jgi:hypothetical protein